MTYEEIRHDEAVNTYIRQADAALAALGFTEHSFAHVTLVAEKAGYILQTLGYPERTVELAKIAGYLHDIGNLINRVDHSQSGAIMAFRILDHLSYDMLHLPDVISIDEFKGNAGGHKFQCIITNPKKRQVLDILPEKTTESLSGYFSRFRDIANVKYIVMDMSCVFRSMANTCFPKAQIVADKYHVQRQVAWAFEDMRKRVQQKFAANRRRYFKRSRYIMLKNIHKLNEEEKQQLTVMLGLSEELAASYFLLQKFYEVMQSKDRVTAKKRLSEWYLHVGSTDSRIYSRFHKCVNTFIEWNDEILNAFETGFTNGYTEGCNNKIKVIKRNAYGLRNFHRFKQRIMHVMA